MKFICSHWETPELMLDEFEVSRDSLDGADICVVSGEFDDYEEGMTCIYRQHGEIYMIEASHCSCYGFEGQWEPDATAIETIQHYAEKGYGDTQECAKLFLESIAQQAN